MAELKTWKEEFSPQSFTFHYTGHFNAFIRPIFETISPFRYIIYKLIICIYVFIWLILSICFNQDYNFLFLDKVNQTLDKLIDPNSTDHTITFLMLEDGTIYKNSYKKYFWIYYYTNQIYLLIFAYFLLNAGILISIYFHYLKVINIKEELSCLICCSSSDNQTTTEIQMPSLANATNKTTVIQQPQQQQPKITLMEASAAWTNNSNILNYPKLFINLLWFIYTAIFPLTIAVTLLFIYNESNDSKIFNYKLDDTKNLVYLADGTLAQAPNKVMAILLAVNFNIISTIIILIEFFISLIPVRIYHFYIPTSYLVIYSIILAFCYWFDADNFHLVYSNVTEFLSDRPFWQFIVFLVIAMWLLHLIHSLLYRFKVWLYYDVLKLKNLAPVSNH